MKVVLCCVMAASSEPPPTFVSEIKSYVDYKADLEMWSRITSLDPKLQAEMVVYRLEGDPSRIKEKIVTQIGEKLKNNPNGIKELISFLDKIYKVDDMASAWGRYVEFCNTTRKHNQTMEDFISEWQSTCFKAKKVGCDFSDTILAFKLLQDSNLSEIDVKLVLTGVDYSNGLANKDLLQQVCSSLKKFKGQSVVTGNSADAVMDVKIEPAWLTRDAQHVLVANGWKPPPKGPRRRSRSASPVKQSNYKGRKNKLDANFRPLKCHICRCKCVDNCNCPCVYHLQADCPRRRRETSEEGNEQLSLFMNTVFGDDSKLVL